MNFGWDENKNQENIKKHNVLFEQNYYQTIEDKNISMDMLVCDNKVLNVTISL